MVLPAVVSQPGLRVLVFRRLTVLLISATCFPVALYAQTSLTRIIGPQDQTIVVPSMSSAPLGQKDAAALQEILDYMRAVKGGGWTGLQATGTLSNPQPGTEGQSTAAGSPAILTIQNGNAYRLDVNASEGQRSLRISAPTGEVQESDGTKHTLPLATAQNGLFAFPRLLSAAFPGAQTTLIDQGIVQIDGRSLHRISLEEPVFADEATAQPETTALLDLYFDPATHLLVKSAGSVQLDPSDRERYLQVVTYSDYRQTQGVLIPYQYSQTLNGQPQWTLNLTEVQLRPSVSPDFFNF